jgi:hypothetical protein
MVSPCRWLAILALLSVFQSCKEKEITKNKRHPADGGVAFMAAAAHAGVRIT